ncbi:uncharacterized protein LOC119072027 [Bradysia coprophila]|uniref:uncharacterized protein LOC119072027 n=1 Tax=Bradysia coprophila TaxID=38358 RepID=UPI00187DD532|nr:uncharacterized protein LOC119072027 [Bradysia coprophila]
MVGKFSFQFIIIMGRCKKQPKKSYSQQQLFSAIQAVRNGASQFASAKKFGIPRSTLFNKITGKTLLGKKPGPATVLLPEEEQTIENWVFGLAVRGFPVTKRQLLRSIQFYLNINKRKTIFKNNIPGRKWYDSFRERHPLISEKLSQNLTVRRAAVSANAIRAWHAEIVKYCEEHSLMDALKDPERVFNMDEKGFILTPNNEVVLVKRGNKAVYNRSKNDEKECVTALLGGSASGKMTPPMIIHSYKRMPSAVLANNPAKWSVGISDNGWQTQQTFHDYITNIFYKWLLEEKVPLPVLLFIDGHKSHVSLTLSDFCASHHIELIALHPNSTHLTQPMDVGVFKPLNTSWTNQAKDWRIANQYAKIAKKDVAPILEKAIKAINYGEHLKNAFKKSGIFPFNVDNIDLSRVLPSIEASASGQEQLWNPQQATDTIHETSEEVNIQSMAQHRLEHFENILGSTVLNSFRSTDVWTGAKEYSILFTIWKRMYIEALESIDTDTSDVIIVVDSDEISENVTKVDGAKYSLVDGANRSLLMEGVDIHTESLDAVQLKPDASDSNTIPSGPDTDDRDHFSTDIIGNQADTSSANAHPSAADRDDRKQCTEKGIYQSKIAKPTGTDESVEVVDKFNPAAFKEAFFWPIEEPKKVKKAVPKIPSVMSSEDWRDHERKKSDEKQQKQVELDARKAARAAKKLEASKIAAEKLVLKQKKQAEKLVDEKRSPFVGSKPNTRQRRTKPIKTGK